ncbi:MAG: SpaA isopeptide-forming pilin-related protein [Propionicimonas sp.]|uniref:MSCRAMM family protein n=1 Tax=Propionicimonas sp. TaxID=1955623 RepID=UPI002B1ECA71|nr:SpaA isopeptide-forming pilin-related protein [Propionicimonas sp.]MEA4945583.1 SpaA isopeptide-forming pilin-related protein [Propionicimonas sp.]
MAFLGATTPALADDDGTVAASTPASDLQQASAEPEPTTAADPISISNPDAAAGEAAGEDVVPVSAATTQPALEPDSPVVVDQTDADELSEPQPEASQVSEPASQSPAAAVNTLAITPLAAGDPTCSYADAGTGVYARTLCWLNFDGLTTEYTDRGTGTNPRYVAVLGAAYGSATAATNLHSFGGKYYGPITGYPVTISFGSGYTFTAKLTITAANGARGLGVTAVGFPAWADGGFLGQSGHYTGVGGKPALYQAITTTGTTSFRTTTVTLSDIKLAKASTVVTDYSVVVADAESTDSGESISWTSTGSPGFRWVPNDPVAWAAATTNTARKTAAVGTVACSGSAANLFPAGTVTAPSCTNAGGGTTSNGPMLEISPTSTTSSFSVTQTMVGNGLQGVAFGVVLAGVQVTVDVADRIVDSTGAATDPTNFTGTFLRSATETATAQTGTTALTATTSPWYLPVSVSTAAQLTLSTTATGTAASSSYSPAWVCLRSDRNTLLETRWPTTGSSATPPTGTAAQLLHGSYLDCTVSYTPPYLSLVKQVSNTGTAATHTAADFTLSATGTVSTITGAGNTAAAVTKRPVAVGSYTLTETAPSGGTAWPGGYTWSGLACSGGTPTVTTDPATTAVTSAAVQVTQGAVAACTYTNRANPRPATVTIAKQVQDVTGNNPQPAGGWTVGATLENPTAGTTISTPATASTQATTGQVANPWTVRFPPGNGTADVRIQESSQTGYTFVASTCVITGTAGTTRTQNLTAASAVMTGLAPGEAAACTFVNRPQPGTVSWQKADASAGAQRLAGSEWRIIGPSPATTTVAVTDCVAADAAACTGADQDPAAGVFQVTGLAWGSYELVETKAPAGYLLDQTPHPFTISAEALTQNFGTPFQNQSQTAPILPFTGGLGRDFYTLLGLAISGLAGLTYGIWRTRTRRRATVE